MTVPFDTVSLPDPQLRAEAAGMRAGNPERDAAIGTLGPLLDRLSAGQGRSTAPRIDHPELLILTAIDVSYDDDHADEGVLQDLSALTGTEMTHLVVDPYASSEDDDDPTAAPEDGNEGSGTDGGELDFDPESPGAGAADPEEVLDHAAYLRALAAGRALADQRIDGGADLLVPVVIGSAHQRAAMMLATAITGMEPVEAIGFDYTDAQLWGEQVAAVRDLLFRARAHGGDTAALLIMAGDPVLTALTAFCAQAAVRQVPVVLDGLSSHVAGILAHRLAPGSDSWFCAAQTAPTRLGRRLQEILGISPIADLGVTAENGAAALLSVGLLRQAMRLLELGQPYIQPPPPGPAPAPALATPSDTADGTTDRDGDGSAHAVDAPESPAPEEI